MADFRKLLHGPKRPSQLFEVDVRKISPMAIFDVDRCLFRLLWNGLVEPFERFFGLCHKARNVRISYVQTHYFPRILECRRAGFPR